MFTLDRILRLRTRIIAFVNQIRLARILIPSTSVTKTRTCVNKISNSKNINAKLWNEQIRTNLVSFFIDSFHDELIDMRLLTAEICEIMVVP